MSTTVLTDPQALIEADLCDPALAEVVALRSPHAPAAQQYRLLAHRVARLAAAGAKALAFTSPHAGEGRTTTVVNTAVCLGRGGRQRVVLVDADVRGPAVHRLLGLKARAGLWEVAAGRASLDDALWRFSGGGDLSVLPAGQVASDAHLLLDSAALGRVLTELRQRFDVVLLDAPRAVGLADVPLLCRDLDGAILVVRAARTSRDDLTAALEALAGVAVHGVILNGAPPAGPPPRPTRALLPPSR